MMLYLTIFVTSLAFIALRAFQQLNVQHDRYLWVPPTTALMALCEVVNVTGIIAAKSLWVAAPLAAGGVLGCWFAMWLHKKMRNK